MAKKKTPDEVLQEEAEYARRKSMEDGSMQGDGIKDDAERVRESASLHDGERVVVKDEDETPSVKVLDRLDRALTVPQQGTRISHCPTSLNLNTIRGRAMMLKAMGPADEELKGDQPLRLIVTDWALIPDSREDEETGEIEEFVRTVFFARDGRTFRTTSAYSPLRLCAMLELFRPEEWRDGLPIIITARVGRRGRVYHDIQIDMEERMTT